MIHASNAEGRTWRAPWLSTSLALIAFAADRFQWDLAMRRDAVLGGDVFRLVTGHFAHFNRAHLLGDALAFAFWAACLEQRGSVRLASRLLVTTLGSSLVFLAFFPEVHEYRGLSAIDCALAAELVALGVEGRWRAGDVTGTALFAVAGVAFVAKTAFEFLAGRAVLAPRLGDSVSLLPVAHLAGIALGLTCWAVDRATARTWARPGSARPGSIYRRCSVGVVRSHADRVRRRATPRVSDQLDCGALVGPSADRRCRD